MSGNPGSVTRVALIVALGGFLMGFDASVISGVVGFIEPEFGLTKLELGWAVASLTLAATLAMMAAGPLSDRIGRKPVLQIAALLFAVSAIASALAGSFTMLVLARIVGGAGVGMALIVAPMYIAEISPAEKRGQMVSFNQLNIVVGISAAFFSNYLVIRLGQSSADWVSALHLQQWNWRWMLGLETVPAVFYLICLGFVPESPRWLLLRGQRPEALAILARVAGEASARADCDAIVASLEADRQTGASAGTFSMLFSQPMRLVLVIGLTVAVLQQITGINSVFFYAPMIFEQSGIGTDAAFMQAILVGLTNLVFTVVAMTLIDRLGRKPLLVFGLCGIALSMLLISWSFGNATYTLSHEAISALPAAIDQASLLPLQGVTFNSDVAFRSELVNALGSETFGGLESQLNAAAIDISAVLVLTGILAFVACFALSIGPVMWVLFSELFPNRVRAIGISFVGLVNSAVSFTVQLLFPWQLTNLGNATTFFLYGLFAVVGLFVVVRLLPETRGRSLEQLEQVLGTA